MGRDAGPGCRYALAIALAALVVLGLAVGRPEAGNFLSEYQILIAARARAVASSTWVQVGAQRVHNATFGAVAGTEISE